MRNMRESRLNKLGWGSRADLAAKSWSQPEIDGLAKLLCPRISYIVWGILLALTIASYVFALYETGWVFTLGAAGTLGLLIALHGFGALVWSTISSRVGGRRRNVGLALRSILLSLEETQRDAHWRARLLKQALDFHKAAERACATTAFSQKATRTILSWQSRRISDDQIMTAQKQVKISAETFHLDGRLDVEKLRSSTLNRPWWSKAPALALASVTFLGLVATNLKNVFEFVESAGL